MAQINIRIEDDLKTRAEELFATLGLTMTAAINMFIHQSVREEGIPFQVTTRSDPFFSERNLAILRKSIADAEQGKLTAHELLE